LRAAPVPMTNQGPSIWARHYEELAQVDRHLNGPRHVRTSKDLSDISNAASTNSTRTSDQKLLVGFSNPEGLHGAGPGEEETWDFDQDTYTVGMLSVMNNGLIRSVPPLTVAFITPFVQTLAFFIVFQDLLHVRPDSDEVSTRDSVAWSICFFLAGLQMSNEAAESFKKLVFSLRCIGGAFDTGQRSPLAVVLATMQWCFSVGTMAICLLVVGQQGSAVDAFMNYVAMGFLTEIDNLLLESNCVKTWINTETEISPRRADNVFLKATDPWTLQMMLSSLAMTGLLLAVCAHAVDLSDQAKSPPILHEWLSQLPHGGATMLILVCMMYLFSLFTGASQAGFLIGIISQVLCAADLVLRRNLEIQTWNLVPLSNMVLFLSGPIVFASGCAMASNPFLMLNCPVRVPIFIWVHLGLGVFWLDTVYRSGLPWA